MREIMKTKTAAVLLISTLLMTLTGCGSRRIYDYDLEDYVKVGEYKGLPCAKIDVEVTDEEIEDEVEKVLQKYSTQTERTEGTIKKGDYVNILYELQVDGDKVDGASSEDYTIRVGDGQILKDIDKALLGKKPGDVFDVETTFPKDYELSSELAGKDAVFTITVNKLYDVTFPELNDEFVSENLGFDTVNAYMEDLKNNLYEEKLESARYDAGEEIWKTVLENAEVIKYPKKEVKERQATLTENFKVLCEQYGTTFEDALSSILQTDEEAFNEEMKNSAEDTVKKEMILYYIARENGLEMTSEEQADYLKEVLEGNEMTEKEFKEKYSKTIEDYAEENGIFTSLLYERVFDFLVDNGVAK